MPTRNKENQRRWKITQATPKWLTEAQRREIHDIYCRAKFLNRMWRMNGAKLSRLSSLKSSRKRDFYSVDHIVPLDGRKKVCGLHVPWNLRIIERDKDNRKGDKLE